jgi:hypothetical protein
MHSDRKLPERSAAGIDLSAKTNIASQARAHVAPAAPEVAGGDLFERIEHRMGKRELDL